MTVEYIIKLRDKFSPVVKKVNNSLGLFRSKLKTSEKSLDSFTAKSEKARMSLAKLAAVGASLYGITSFAKDALKAWDIQMKAEEQVRQGLISTHNAAKLSFEELKKYASYLQTHSLYGDEEILQNVTAQLLTFTDIQGETFKQAEQIALDLSARLGQDLKTSAIQVGKALNDPVQGVTALSRVGVQFTEQQKEMIKYLVETGQKAKAQQIILEELQKEYGGSAEAAARSGLGAIQQLQMRLGDLKEVIGGVIYKGLEKLLPYFDKFVGWLEKGAAWLDENSEKVMQFGQAVAIAVGALSSFTVVQKTLSLLIKTSPLGLLLTAVTGLAYSLITLYKTSEPVKQAFDELFGLLKAIGVKIFGQFKAIIEKTFGAFQGKGKLLEDVVLKIVKAITANLIPTINKILAFLAPVFNVIIDTVQNDLMPILSAVWGILVGLFNALKPLLNTIFSRLGKIIFVLSVAFKIVVKIFKALFLGISKFIKSNFGQFLIKTLVAPLQMALELLGKFWDMLYKAAKWVAKQLGINMKAPKLVIETKQKLQPAAELAKEDKIDKLAESLTPTAPMPTPPGGTTPGGVTSVTGKVSGGGVIKLNITNLVNTINIHVQKLDESKEEIKRYVIEALEEGLHDVVLVTK